uniref:Uncharacterized protein n=1 Tax=Timema monikensis TaxID=170555 RepID=A0A7R9EFK8_9NEOP|nr:unnamed protein product [Timema monikensis]
MDMKSMEFAMLMYSIGLITLSLFVYALIVTELASQSAAVSQAAYDSEWYDSPKSYKMCILTIIARAQKPVVLTAGKFSQFTLEEFSTIGLETDFKTLKAPPDGWLDVGNLYTTSQYNGKASFICCQSLDAGAVKSYLAEDRVEGEFT